MLLDEELGLEPGVELQELERAILVQDPALNLTTNDAITPRTDTRERRVCPFKGLAPFEAADAEFFFGRERLVDELVARLAAAPLLAVIGPSGSGKSSLLRAGLLPAIDSRQQVVVRPGERPAAELVSALGGSLPEASSACRPASVSSSLSTSSRRCSRRPSSKRSGVRSSKRSSRRPGIPTAAPRS